ncbi:hypothetical protein E1293_45750 [Actinomadura darangshiensis]|uniref:Deoxyribonuclease NucA/NucB domain-containing protein n=1 Tax=Actinomadura darangshiensis TaxID=705336 RepID=A0A4R4ZQU3_9ACTN|nr:hypothetical protein E1293_45750 [Actinomadura darangshiensis]
MRLPRPRAHLHSVQVHGHRDEDRRTHRTCPSGNPEPLGPIHRRRDRQAAHTARRQSLADKNRTAACAAAPDPRPTSKDCDEYPFAATYQGAALEGKGDFHWELIDSSDNRAEGAYRKQFYLENRVVDEDPFWVKIVP